LVKTNPSINYESSTHDPNFLTTLISLKSTSVAVFGSSITFKTASTAIGESSFEQDEITFEDKQVLTQDNKDSLSVNTIYLAKSSKTFKASSKAI